MRARGLTLVELLVAIAIVGVLVALLLPAVQSVRESARRAQCANNLRQISVAFHLHHEAHGHFPTGGWSWNWVGDPDLGYGAKQPGGWVYNILAFMEGQQVRNLGQDGQPNNVTEVQKSGAAISSRTALSWYYCPSRRHAKLYPFNPPWFTGLSQPAAYNCGVLTESARIDYGANSGDNHKGAHGGPHTLSDGLAGQGFDQRVFEQNGVVTQRSMVSIQMITDGTAHTYIVGEKQLNPDHYETGLYIGDWVTPLVGGSADLQLGTNFAPRRDVVSYDSYGRFGSAHASVFQVASCDGSVDAISYGIDFEVHRARGPIADGR